MENIVEVIIKFIAGIASIATTVISVIIYKGQKKHSEDSVRPLANILISNYENRIAVRIKNCGSGPLTITEIKCSDNSKETFKKETKENLIGFFENGGIEWSDYVNEIKGKSISANESLILLKIEGEEKVGRYGKQIREKLNNIKITIKYKDIYGKEMTTVERELNFKNIGKLSKNSSK